MIDNIESPAAIARVTWLTAEQGGRRSGPPTAPVYAANCAFPLGGENEVVPGWPGTAEKFSVLLQKQDVIADGSWVCKVDFLARHLVAPHLRTSAEMLVMEGPKVVAHAIITGVAIDQEAEL